ncbi:flagellar type III secretion system protein FlhB [Thalassovita sp.]|uniref:EscU/YscU/HrcU family type III secretion system export apparatus switch protein n=1 Tax=Thalassovita sp. TaxID=1979401 RepID=UPI0029DE6CFB|nr:flagellar type III secretion system protein FlhB [Thalassovita sp.]
MSSKDESEKSHEPSQRKLDEARKKGEIVRSADITTAAAFAGLLLALVATGQQGIGRFGDVMMTLLAQSDALAAEFRGGGADVLTAHLMRSVLGSIGIWFAFPVAAAIAAVAAQRAFVFAPTKLTPRLSRLSLIANAKNKFGPSGLFEFIKSTAKLIIFATCLGLFMAGKFAMVSESVQMEPAVFMPMLAGAALQFLLICVAVMAALGAVDYLWQRHRHLAKHRMSHKELRDEHKEAEGDPHLKQERRARARQVATHQMVAQVSKADVVVVNPTHFSVALKWSRKRGEAPVCVAKGVDEAALQIREIAREHGVPIHADPPTARALHAGLNVGDQIQEEHFRAVAVAIRFAEDMRKKARRMR